MTRTRALELTVKVDVGRGANFRLSAFLSGRGNARVLISILIDTVGTGMFMSLVLLYLALVNGIPPVLAGPLITIAAVLSFVAMPLVGRLIHRLRGRNSLILSGVISAVGYTLYFFAREPVTVLVAASLVALGDRLNGAAWPVLAAEQFGRDRLTLLFAITNSAKTVALGAGALAAAAALAAGNEAGLRIALAANVTSYLVGLIVLLSVKRHVITAERTPIRSLSIAFRNPGFMRLVLSQMSLSASWIIPGVAFPLYLTEGLGQPAALAAVMLTLRYGVVAAIQVPIVRMTRSWDRQRILAFSGACSASGVLCVIALPFAWDGWLIALTALATALLALSEIISKPTAAADAIRYSPPGEEAPYMAVFQSSWTFAYAIGPAAIGLGLQAPPILWFIILIIVVGGIAYGTSQPRKLEATVE